MRKDNANLKKEVKTELSEVKKEFKMKLLLTWGLGKMRGNIKIHNSLLTFDSQANYIA